MYYNMLLFCLIILSFQLETLKQTKHLCCDSVFTNVTNLLLCKDSFRYRTIEQDFRIVSTIMCHFEKLVSKVKSLNIL